MEYVISFLILSWYLLAEVRNTDIPIRYGGEEFTIFIPTQMVESGVQFAERMRQKIQETEFTSIDPISAGVVFHQQNESLVDLIHRADEKLYQAKQSGRNQVCVELIDDRK